jgi:hypothetical protein
MTENTDDGPAEFWLTLERLLRRRAAAVPALGAAGFLSFLLKGPGSESLQTYLAGDVAQGLQLLARPS